MKLNKDFQGKLDSVVALHTVAFDNAYLGAMEFIHAKDGAAFAKEAKSGTKKDLKAFAAETDRIVLRHIGERKTRVGNRQYRFPTSRHPMPPGASLMSVVTARGQELESSIMEAVLVIEN